MTYVVVKDDSLAQIELSKFDSNDTSSVNPNPTMGDPLEDWEWDTFLIH